MRLNRVVLMLAIVTAAALVIGGVALWSPWQTHADSPRPMVMTLPAAAADLASVPLRQPILISRASLTEDYEHYIEHVPPRGVDGEMQDRERFGTAPLNPFELGADDSELRQKLQFLKKRYIAGEVVKLEDPESFLKLCLSSNVEPIQLLRAARSFYWLGLPQWGAAIDQAAIAKATSSAGIEHAGDLKLLPLIRELDATGPLWQLREFDVLEQRFHLAASINPPQSVAARRSHVLRAIVLREVYRYKEACAELTQAWADSRVMNDFTPADIAEMNWLTAITFVPASRFGQAEPYCKEVMKLGGQRGRDAALLDIVCLGKLGRTAEADEITKKYHFDEPPTQPARTTGT